MDLSHGSGGRASGGESALSHLHRTRVRVGEEDGVAARDLGDVLDGVEVLVHEQERHDVLGLHSGDGLLEVGNGLLEAHDGGLALLGETDTAEALRLGITLGGLDGLELVGLGLVLDRLLHAGVGDGRLHRVLERLRQADVGDERGDDEVAELLELGVELGLEVFLHLGAHQEDLVERVLGEHAADDVHGVGRQLALGVGEHVVGVDGLLGDDLGVDDDADGDHDVVARLGLAVAHEGADAQRDLPGDGLGAGVEADAARGRHGLELAQRLDHAQLGLRNSCPAGAHV